MATPKLKVGDTFVYTEEMSTATHRRWRSGKDKNRDLIGKTLEVASFTSTVTSNLDCYTVKINGDQFSFVCEDIDWFLPETKPRTLDDVKEGDVLELIGDRELRRVVLGRAGKFIIVGREDDTDKFYLMTLDSFKKNYKLADQPEERWKPEMGEWYENVDEFGEVNEASWRDDDIDNERWNLGNCFKKGSGEAQKAASELKEFWRGRINNQK